MGISLDAWQARGRVFEFHRRSIFYVDEGEGEVVVCVHGFPTASWDWSWIWTALTARYRVIAPDMLGFGFSSKPTGYSYTLREQAVLHERLLDVLHIPRAHILAHNYGDSVAQELMARFHERSGSGEPGLVIRSVCLLNGGIIPSEHRPRPIQRLLAGRLGPLIGRLTTFRRFRNGFSEIFGPNTKPSDEELRRFWRLIDHNGGRRVLHKLIAYMQERMEFKNRWVGALQEASMPLRFINGPEDPISGRHMAEAYSRLVPNPDVVLLEGIGHYPQVEAPEQTLAAYVAFVESLGKRSEI